jgi:hypothetical protein
MIRLFPSYNLDTREAPRTRDASLLLLCHQRCDMYLKGTGVFCYGTSARTLYLLDCLYISGDEVQRQQRT